MNIKLAWYKSIFAIIAILLLLANVFTCVFDNNKKQIVITKSPHSEGAFSEFIAGDIYTQEFTCDRANLSKVGVLFGQYYYSEEFRLIKGKQ